MKIAIIVNPLIPVPPQHYGGIERIVYMLIRELLNFGHHVTLFAHPGSQPGCRLIGYNESKNYGTKDLLKINLLTSKIAFGNFDLLHTFGRMDNIAALLLSKIPKVVSYQLPPTVGQVKKAVRIARKNSLYFTACSNYIAGQIKDYCDVTTIYNGVDVSEYIPRYEIGTSAPLVFLGRIQKEKGTAIAIEVARQSGNKLIIAGNVPDEPLHLQYFETEVKPYIDGGQITYIGPVNNTQKNELLRNCKAFLMPVLWDEPFGIVMAEALACGAPIIGFRRGAVPEVVSDGENGFVCDNIEEMINAVTKIGDISREKCRKIVETTYSATVLAKQYEQLYLRIVSKR
ncbi:MAG: glycosyl transferase group 1 [Mucilaginibacter sp.]|nr:glycosyl transferase group 1 [Mucilaginibacter sp.]